MTLPRDEVASGLRAEIDRFDTLSRWLDDGRWNAPKRSDPSALALDERVDIYRQRQRR
jgi:hypothetical protein